MPDRTMADAPYLIALALLQQGEQRAMPLQGKSLPAPLDLEGDPGETGHRQALELLVRVWQRSDNGSLQRAFSNRSLLLVELPMAALMDTLPAIKSRWLKDGDGGALLEALSGEARSIWSLELEGREPLAYRRLHPTVA